MADPVVNEERVLLRLTDVPWMLRPNAVESVLAAHPEDSRLVTSTVVFV